MAAGMMLLGNVLAQQTPAANPPQSSAPESTSNPAFKTQKDKVSYAIGMNIGTSLHKQSIEVDPKILQQGLEDALAGGKTLISRSWTTNMTKDFLPSAGN